MRRPPKAHDEPERVDCSQVQARVERLRVRFIYQLLAFAWSGGIAMLVTALMVGYGELPEFAALSLVLIAWGVCAYSLVTLRCPRCDAMMYLSVKRLLKVRSFGDLRKLAQHHGRVCSECGLDWMLDDLATPIRTSLIDRFGWIAVRVIFAVWVAAAILSILLISADPRFDGMLVVFVAPVIPLILTTVMVRLRDVCRVCGRSSFLNVERFRATEQKWSPFAVLSALSLFSGRCASCGCGSPHARRAR